MNQNVPKQFKMVQTYPEGFIPCPKWSKMSKMVQNGKKYGLIW